MRKNALRSGCSVVTEFEVFIFIVGLATGIALATATFVTIRETGARR